MPTFNNFPIHSEGTQQVKGRLKTANKSVKERKSAFQYLVLSRRAMESKAKNLSSIPSGFMILP